MDFVSTHGSLAGADSAKGCRPSPPNVSTHGSLAGADGIAISYSKSRWMFQLTAPLREPTKLLNIFAYLYIVSTHGSLAGADFAICR